MATEFPIDPEFGRNEPPAPEDQGMEVQLDLEQSNIEELPDGSAVVTMDDFKGPEEDEEAHPWLFLQGRDQLQECRPARLEGFHLLRPLV